MTQEEANRFHRNINKSIEEFQTGKFEEAIERLELLTIYFKELFKEKDN